MESVGALRFTALWYGLGWLLIATIVYLSLTFHPPEPLHFVGADKVEHVVAYIGLMMWFSQLQLTYRQRLRNAILFMLMGVAIEFLQGMGGVRQFEYADMAADCCGILLGWGLGWMLRDRALTAVDNFLAKRFLAH